MLLILWTIGAIGTFGLFMLADIPDQAADMLPYQPGDLPLWALQMAIALGCVALWPLMLILLAIDVAAHLLGGGE